MRVERMIAHDRIGANLPENEIGMGRDDRAIEPSNHLWRLFAVDAAIEHGDVIGREALLEFDREPTRIACRRRACAGAGGG